MTFIINSRKKEVDVIKKYIALCLISYSLYGFQEVKEKRNVGMQKTSSIFYIEGNTGSGKTTLLHALAQKYPDIVALEEPVEDVQDVEGMNALQLMYEDLHRWSLTVNLLYYSAHINHLKQSMLKFDQQTIVSDRSIYSGLAFMHADNKAGAIHPIENILYERLVAFASSSLPKPAGFIYVRTNPETSFVRIRKRNRPEEAHISSDYWKLLHEGHEQMLLHDNSFLKDIPVLVVDFDGDVDEHPVCIDEAIEKIAAFIQDCTQKDGIGCMTAKKLQNERQQAE